MFSLSNYSCGLCCIRCFCIVLDGVGYKHCNVFYCIGNNCILVLQKHFILNVNVAFQLFPVLWILLVDPRVRERHETHDGRLSQTGLHGNRPGDDTEEGSEVDQGSRRWKDRAHEVSHRRRREIG